MRAAHALLFSIASVVLAACVREGPPVVAPVDTVEVGDAGAASTLVVIARPPVPTALEHQRCSARLRASTIKTPSNCQLDERISHGDGKLFYPCTGDGPVDAVFGEHTFHGEINDKLLVLALTTEPDWDDGCHWESKQGLRGAWSRGAESGKLAWTYSERPVSGTHCLGACKATADIEIEGVSPP
jgi:hypothetical protein